jgi:hypothetical protein
MGADLLIACFSEPMDKNFKPDWDKARTWIEEQSKVWIKTDTLPNEIDWMGEPEDAGKQLLGYLQQVEEAYDAGRRDLCSLEFPPVRVHLTGGMSWGDDPSDIYQPINILNELGLLDMVGFNNIPNYKTMIEKILSVKEMHPLLIGLDNDLDAMLEKEFINDKKPRKGQVPKADMRPAGSRKKPVKPKP